MKCNDFATLAICAMWPALPVWSAGENPVHAHHLRFAQPRALGRKVSDEFTVPLCNLHHREVHTPGGDEAAWWQENKLSPLAIAQELWATSRRHRGATALQAECPKGHSAGIGEEAVHRRCRN